MLVRDAISRTPVVTIDANDTLEHAARLLLERGIRHLPVIEDGRLAGVLSERDVVAFRGYGGFKAPVSMALVRTELETASPDDELEAVARRMASRKVGCVPVVEGGRVVGIVTTTDLLAGHVGQAGRALAVSGLEARVGEVMSRDVLTVHPDDRLLDAVGRMSSRAVRHLPVVDGDTRPLGMLSDRDVRRALGETAAREGEAGLQRRVSEYRVQDVARRPALTIDEDATLLEAARRMLDDHVGALVVTGRDGRVAGLVSYVDVLAKLAGRLAGPSGVAVVPPEPAMPAPAPT
jgi:CBS domain-containing protein